MQHLGNYVADVVKRQSGFHDLLHVWVVREVKPAAAAGLHPEASLRRDIHDAQVGSHARFNDLTDQMTNNIVGTVLDLPNLACGGCFEFSDLILHGVAHRDVGAYGSLQPCWQCPCSLAACNFATCSLCSTTLHVAATCCLQPQPATLHPSTCDLSRVPLRPPRLVTLV